MGLIIDIQEKRFGRKKIFENLNLSFPDKGLFILSANSGRGKTTLLRIIAGLDRDFSGSVIGGGASNVSFHFQEYRLFDNLTALDNVAQLSFKELNQENTDLAVNTLKCLGFSEEDIHLYPKELSGGMKIRVSFARAILRKTPILLLDEPTKELDRETVGPIYTYINDISKERLVILVTHERDLSNFDNPNVIKL